MQKITRLNPVPTFKKEWGYTAIPLYVIVGVIQNK
jgi:hypothetical protein